MFSTNNPFVNDTMFFANKPHYFYNQTSWYFFQVTYNGICFSVGTLLASLIFYLLATQTPPNLKSYRKMLLLVTAVDYFMLSIVCGIYFRLRFTDAALLLTLNGFYTVIFSYRQLCPIMCLYTVIGSIGVSVLPVQYYYRYYTLEKDHSPSGLQVITIFSLIVAPSLIVSPKTMTVCCPPENPNPQGIDYAPMWFEEVPVPELFVELPSEKSLWFYSNNVLLTVYYSIAIFFGILTVKKLKDKFSTSMYSKSAKSLQKQLTRTMVAQSCLPLITLVLPQCIHQITVNLNIASDMFADVSKQTMTLVPICNMLACIIFIKPYRRFCMRLIPCSIHFHCTCHPVSSTGATTMATRMPSSTT